MACPLPPILDTARERYQPTERSRVIGKSHPSHHAAIVGSHRPAAQILILAEILCVLIGSGVRAIGHEEASVWNARYCEGQTYVKRYLTEMLWHTIARYGISYASAHGLGKRARGCV